MCIRDRGVARLIDERFFDGTFPPLKEMKKAVTIAKHPQEDRPAPFQNKTLPSAALTTIAYGRLLAKWLDEVQQEDETPTAEQLRILQRVAERVLAEFRLEHEGLLLPKAHPERTNAEAPLLGLCHGSLGTGNSRVIKWVTRMFVEALGWQHEDEILCVAFQNRVAHAMGGNTLHAGGDIGFGGH